MGQPVRKEIILGLEFREINWFNNSGINEMTFLSSSVCPVSTRVQRKWVCPKLRIIILINWKGGWWIWEWQRRYDFWLFWLSIMFDGRWWELTGGWGDINSLVFNMSSAAPFCNKSDFLCILLPFFFTLYCFKHDDGGGKTRDLPDSGKGTTIWSTLTTAYSQCVQ